MTIELIIFIVFIVCLIPLIIIFRPKVYDYKYTSSESYDDAHELAEKARRDHGQTSVLKAKSSLSAKTTMKESAKKSVAKKHKKHNADKKQVEKSGSNKESWQPYINMLRERYLNMSRSLLLKSWGHPTRPDEFDGGLALIRLGKIWYVCVDGVFSTLGEETRGSYRTGNRFQHFCYRLLFIKKRYFPYFKVAKGHFSRNNIRRVPFKQVFLRVFIVFRPRVRLVYLFLISLFGSVDDTFYFKFGVFFNLGYNAFFPFHK